MVAQKKAGSSTKQKGPEGQKKVPPQLFEVEGSDDDDDDDLDDMDSDDIDSGDSEEPEQLQVQKTPGSNLKTPQNKSAKKDVHVSFQLQNEKTPVNSAQKMQKPRQDTPVVKNTPASQKRKLQEFPGMKGNLSVTPAGKMEQNSAKKAKGQLPSAGKKADGSKKQQVVQDEMDIDDFDDDDDSDDDDSDLESGEEELIRNELASIKAKFVGKPSLKDGKSEKATPKGNVLKMQQTPTNQAVGKQRTPNKAKKPADDSEEDSDDDSDEVQLDFQVQKGKQSLQKAGKVAQNTSLQQSPTKAMQAAQKSKTPSKLAKIAQEGDSDDDDDDSEVDSDDDDIRNALQALKGKQAEMKGKSAQKPTLQQSPKAQQKQAQVQKAKTPNKAQASKQDDDEDSDSDDDSEESDDEIRNVLQSLKGKQPGQKKEKVAQKSVSQQSPTKTQKQESMAQKTKITKFAELEQDDEDSDDDDDDDDDSEESDDDIGNALPALKGKSALHKSPVENKQRPSQTIQKITVKTPKKDAKEGPMPKQERPKNELPEEMWNLELKRKRERDAHQLYIKRLPRDVTMAEMKSLSPDIVDVSLPPPRLLKKKDIRYLYAFLRFASEKKAEENYSLLQNKKFRGQPLLLDFCGEKSKTWKAPAVQEQKNYNLKKLYMPGMSTSTNIGQVAALYPNAASISITSSEEHRTAYVSFHTPEEAAKALKASEELRLDGRLVTVLYALQFNKQKKRKQMTKRRKSDPPAKKFKGNSGESSPSGSQQQRPTFAAPPGKKFKQQTRKERSSDDDDDMSDES